MRAEKVKAARRQARQYARQHGIELQNSYILYEGRSELDRSQKVVAVISGFTDPSSNEKTGDVLQVTYFMAEGHPQDAVDNGCDNAICGDCPFRKVVNGVRLCYVNMQPIFSMWRKYKDGGYQKLPTYNLLRGFVVRYGMYGDPAAIPQWYHNQIQKVASVAKAYTHSWKRFPSLKSFCMASVETDADMRKARALGFKTFRVRATNDTSLKAEKLCLHSSHGVNCVDCPFCQGVNAHAQNIVVTVHGPSFAVKAFDLVYG